VCLSGEDQRLGLLGILWPVLILCNVHFDYFIIPFCQGHGIVTTSHIVFSCHRAFLFPINMRTVFSLLYKSALILWEKL